MNIETRSRWIIIAIGMVAIALVAISAADSQARCYGGVCYPDTVTRALDEVAPLPMPSVVVDRRVAHRPAHTCNRTCALQRKGRCYTNRVACGHRFRLFRRGR